MYGKPELRNSTRWSYLIMLGGLFEQPLDQTLQNRYNPYNAEIVGTSQTSQESAA